jgi:hypothetical protein
VALSEPTKTVSITITLPNGQESTKAKSEADVGVHVNAAVALHAVVALSPIWSALKSQEKMDFLSLSQNLDDLDAQQRPPSEGWKRTSILTSLCRRKVECDDKPMQMAIQRRLVDGAKLTRRRARRLRTSLSLQLQLDPRSSSTAKKRHLVLKQKTILASDRRLICLLLSI